MKQGQIQKPTIKGIRTSCDAKTPWETSEKKEVEMTYHFTTHDFKDGPKEYLHLEGGPTGYESADWNSLVKWAFSFKTRFLHKKPVWAANFGTKDISWPAEEPSEENFGHGEPAGFKLGYDKLDIPSGEIRRIYLERKAKEDYKRRSDRVQKHMETICESRFLCWLFQIDFKSKTWKKSGCPAW